MAQDTTKRKSKDSVFVDLFEDKKYVLQLYKDLHPEDHDVTIDDINVQTIKSVLVNTLYNDLGFLVKDRLIMLVEAQSLWNPNIALRMMFYLSETYRRYLADTEQSEHSGSRVHLPKPDLYVVYSGNDKVPAEISLSEDFFGGASPVDLKVKVLDTVNNTIYGQYIGFCKVFDEQRGLYDNKLECARETIRICLEKGYLKAYLKNRSKEAINMMSELFDEEYLRNQYNLAERRKNFAEGMQQGMLQGMEKGILQSSIDIAVKLLRSGIMPKEEIASITGLSPEKINELEAAAASV